MSHNTKRIAIATLLGVVISTTKTLVPSPINKMLIIIQALLLALSGLLLGRMGATYVALIGGVFTTILNLALAPFTIFFAFLYGLLVDGFFILFNVNIVKGRVKTSGPVAAMTLSTMFVGVISYYVTVHLMGLIPRNLLIEVFILVMGTISGALAGYLSSIIWNNHLKNVQL